MVEYDEARSITLAEARLLLRGRKGTPSIAQVRKWAGEGCHPLGPDSPVIILKAVWVCGRKRTMPQWVADFQKARAAAVGQQRPARAKAMPARGERTRKTAQKRAEARLDEAGVK